MVEQMNIAPLRLGDWNFGMCGGIRNLLRQLIILLNDLYVSWLNCRCSNRHSKATRSNP
jgi:hypothetical protein